MHENVSHAMTDCDEAEVTKQEDDSKDGAMNTEKIH